MPRALLALAGVLTALLASPALAARRATSRASSAAETRRPWPAQGYLLIQVEAGTFACAGTLVSGRWFLTAAHCVSDPSDNSVLPASAFTVRLGSANRNLGSEFGADDVIRHDLYSQSTRSTTSHFCGWTPPPARRHDWAAAARRRERERTVGCGHARLDHRLGHDVL